VARSAGVPAVGHGERYRSFVSFWTNIAISRIVTHPAANSGECSGSTAVRSQADYLADDEQMFGLQTACGRHSWRDDITPQKELSKYLLNRAVTFLNHE
jgi:hypothetical protein